LYTGIIPKPAITVPPPRHLSIHKGSTAEMRCVANASPLKSLTKFRWLKNGENLTLSDHKYSIIEHQVPDSQDKNALESILKVYNVTKQDKGKYSCYVYYDINVLEQLHIITNGDELSDEAYAYLDIAGKYTMYVTDLKDPICYVHIGKSRTVLSTLVIIGIVGGVTVLAVLIAASLLVYFCCSKKYKKG